MKSDSLEPSGALPGSVKTAAVKPDAPPVGPADLILGLALSLVSLLVLHRAWADIARLGLRDEELSYVLLAPVVIAWLAVVRRGHLPVCRRRGEWVGLLILCAGWVLYTYGYWDDKVLWRAGAVIVAVGAFLSATGWDVLVNFAPALAACLFLIPIGTNGRYHFAMPLETVTAAAAQNLCDLVGMSVERTGNLLSINGVGVTIAEACNGMRMMITLLMVCYVVAFSVRVKWTLRFAVLAASPLVAVLANSLRLVPTVWMYGYASAEKAEVFHEVGGWVMTFVTCFVTISILRPLGSKQASERKGGGH
jgi:exosortase